MRCCRNSPRPALPTTSSPVPQWDWVLGKGCCYVHGLPLPWSGSCMLGTCAEKVDKFLCYWKKLRSFTARRPFPLGQLLCSTKPLSSFTAGYRHALTFHNSPLTNDLFTAGNSLFSFLCTASGSSGLRVPSLPLILEKLSTSLFLKLLTMTDLKFPLSLF